MSSIGALSLQIPVWHPTLIGLGLPLASLIDIAEKMKKILTYTQETTRAKLGQLRSARLILRDQTITTRHAMDLNKANELISLLAPTLSIINHDFSQIKLINCHTPFRDSRNEASIRVPRMFHSHVYQQYDKQIPCSVI
jgi:hypothetical protein